MTEERKGSGNPMLDAWLAGQQQFLKAQEPLLSKFGTMMQGAAAGGDASEALARAQSTWELCEKQARDWATAAQHWFEPASAGEPEGIAAETLRRMLDPSRFLYAGTDEINHAIQRLVEGPEFADIGTLERQVLKATKEWLALREASAAHRAVTAAAWSRAFETFSKEMMTKPPSMKDSARSVLDRWLAIANEELIRTQRTDAFLEAQRNLLRAGVDYRLKERELVELWCETHSIPTRTEVDDLHRTVHGLNRRVRDLEKRFAAAMSAPKPEPKRAAPARKSAAKRKTGLSS
jgi:hypothetical protein